MGERPNPFHCRASPTMFVSGYRTTSLRTGGVASSGFGLVGTIPDACSTRISRDFGRAEGYAAAAWVAAAITRAGRPTRLFRPPRTGASNYDAALDQRLELTIRVTNAPGLAGLTNWLFKK